MPLMRKLVKLAVGYAITKALTKHGGPKGLLDSVLDSGKRASARTDGVNAKRGPKRGTHDRARRH